MNREEFIKAIKKLHVPPYLYNLEGSGRNDLPLPSLRDYFPKYRFSRPANALP